MKINSSIQPVSLTSKAISALETIRKDRQIPRDLGLRLGVRGGGCAGFSYILGFDDKKDSDQEYLVGGVKVIIDKAHAMHILGLEIDFEEDPENRGFSFNDPAGEET